MNYPMYKKEQTPELVDKRSERDKEAARIAQSYTDTFHSSQTESVKNAITAAYMSGIDWGDKNPKLHWTDAEKEKPRDMVPVNIMCKDANGIFIMMGHWDSHLKRWSTGKQVLKWIPILEWEEECVVM